MRVRLEIPITIPAGLILHDAPRRGIVYEPFCEEGPIQRFEISGLYVKTHPDRFTILEDDHADAK